uniref:RING-type domain-containing protein n=1 Tax=Oxyrrhis marina TaxID=2969 RepID=A0A7S4LQN9_OXYMA|mmetsp:Transcript_36035/g.94306  ORF Transcript_36035/g.94306 Transcript_36035/m.94306 type:complete len:599 (-) Transcript_36035:5-1801(-)
MGSSVGRELVEELSAEFQGVSRSLVREVVQGYWADFDNEPEAEDEVRKRARCKLAQIREASKLDKNEALVILDSAFPLCPREVLRSAATSEKTVVHAATTLLAGGPLAVPRRVPLRVQDLIPDKEYKEAAYHCLLNEFPLLWKSQITAVMAERNHDYPSARSDCLALMRNRQASFFDGLQRATHTVRRHLRLEMERRAVEESKDVDVARELNRRQYADLGEEVECEICYDAVAWEDLLGCGGGHLFCRGCLLRFVQELVGGEAGPAVLARHQGSVKCLSMDPCDAPIPTLQLEELLPGNMRESFNSFLLASNIPLARRKKLGISLCPFCDGLCVGPRSIFAILKQSWVALSLALIVAVVVLRLRNLSGFDFWLLLAGRSLWACAPVVALLFLFLPNVFGGDTLERNFYLCVVLYFWTMSKRRPAVLLAMGELRRRVTGKRSRDLRCTQCHVLVCSGCNREAHNLRCFGDVPAEGTVEALQHFVEEAISAASIRVCPECGLRFRKGDGCNKMTCRCGYVMCYVCREQVSGYSHFCQHFRPAGGKCDKCHKCEMFATPDDNPEMVAAGRQAVALFVAKHRDIGKRIYAVTAFGLTFEVAG